jgi:hypothetical protein
MTLLVDIIPGTTSMLGNLQLSTGGPASSLKIGISENGSRAAHLWLLSWWSSALTFLERHFAQQPVACPCPEQLEVLHQSYLTCHRPATAGDQLLCRSGRRGETTIS